MKDYDIYFGRVSIYCIGNFLGKTWLFSVLINAEGPACTTLFFKRGINFFYKSQHLGRKLDAGQITVQGLGVKFYLKLFKQNRTAHLVCQIGETSQTKCSLGR
jgi:hypothetical protein